MTEPRHGSEYDDQRWAAWAAQGGDAGRPGERRSRSADWFGAEQMGEPEEPRAFRSDYRPADRSGHDRAEYRQEPRPDARSAQRPVGQGRPVQSRPAQNRPLQSRSAQGLAVFPAFVLSLVLSTVCGVANTFVLNSVSLIFATGFLVGTVYVAARIRYRDLLWALIIPPIVYAMALGVARLFVDRRPGQDALAGQLVDLSTVLATKAPLLLAGETVALVIALIRVFAYRKSNRWKRSPWTS